MLLAVLLGLACSPDPPVASAPVQPVQPAQPVQAPAAVSIQRQRGALLRDGATLAFRPCGGQELLAIQGAAAADLDEVYTALAGGDPAALVNVELTGAVREVGEGRVLNAASLAVALPPGQDSLCAFDSSFSYQAHGREPFWAITVAGEQLSYSTPELETPLELPVTPTRHPGGAIAFVGEQQGHRVDLSLQSSRCRDDMSGAVYPLTATVEVDGSRLHGCAQEGWSASAR